MVSKLIVGKMEIDFIAEASNCLSPPKMYLYVKTKEREKMQDLKIIENLAFELVFMKNH